MWNPKLGVLPHKESNNKLLWKAFTNIQPAQIQDRMSDEEGLFALNLNKCILVAKSYIYGYIVSAHKKAVYSALNQKKKLIMYIGKDDKFYSFDPVDILEKSEVNTRGKAIMLNWNIKLGKRFETL